MGLSYDQRSELSIAFHEAHVPSERRRSQRIKTRIAADLTEWANDRPGRTFGVMIEDFSTTGVGMVQSGHLKPGGKYTLEIPRPGRVPMKVLLTVVSCHEVDGGLFSTRLEASDILAGREALAEQPRARESYIGMYLAILATMGTVAGVAFYFLG